MSPREIGPVFMWNENRKTNEEREMGKEKADHGELEKPCEYLSIHP